MYLDTKNNKLSNKEHVCFKNGKEHVNIIDLHYFFTINTMYIYRSK
jgi:hypothetical protein